MYKKEDIAETIGEFELKHDPCGRYASFDYCYNYFHPSNNNDITQDMEKSCTALGFYLASWGMFRGSSFILEKSSKNFIPTLEYIASLPKNIWDIDVCHFNEENIENLIEIYNNIKNTLINGNNSHITLVTKIMLGIFASVPAYDRFFIQTFSDIFKGECGFTSFNKNSLNCISKFYQSNQITLNHIANELKTIDFITGNTTNLAYTKSKIIDMYGFTKGLT